MARFQLGQDRDESSGGFLNRFADARAQGRRLKVEQERAAEAVLLMRNFEDSALGWFWSTDSEGRLTYLSDSVAPLLTNGSEGLLGLEMTDIFSRADEDESGRGTLSFLLAKHSAFEKLILRASTGISDHVWSFSGRPQFDRSGRFTGFRGCALDVTEQRKSSEFASRLAKYDPLTGLPNRRRMTEILESSLLAAEHRRQSCAIILIDLDRFKQVNDTLGHPAGDALLKQVAERLVRLIGDGERVFRLGGDEFQVILHDHGGREALAKAATDIIARISEPYFISGHRCIIGASIGVAVGLEDGRSRDELIRNADLALYASKAAGRGRSHFFSTDLLKTAEDKRTLEEDLRDSLDKGELNLAYQPVVDVETNRISGVEALVRWQHPRRGNVPPDSFIPLAEEAGLVERLGEWALRKACEEAASWPDRIRVAVNVSPLQFTNRGFPAVVRAALAASALAPDRLELEITEGVFLGEETAADEMFAALKEIGVRLALDDFGTGYSSLGYLRKAPFDKIKIDQSFVREATLARSRNSAIISAIVALGEALGMETTAEGVEYMDQLKLIRSLGVSHAQGWVFSKAIPSDELVQRLADGNWIIEPSGPEKQRSDRQTMYRQVGLVHGHRYDQAVIRNLSESGALIDGVESLKAGTLVLVDFGDGRVTLGRVSRATGHHMGVEFQEKLESDEQGGLRPRRRISPLLLNKAGLPSPDRLPVNGSNALSPEEIARRLGLAAAPWAGESEEVHPLINIIPGSDSTSKPDPRFTHEARLSFEHAYRLVEVAQASTNRQLRYILPLMMFTGARPGELLKGRWDQLDLEQGIWRIPAEAGEVREARLTAAAIRLIASLPRWAECPYLIANPITLKPYQSIVRSWDVVRRKAGLPFMEISDLRYGDVGGADQQHRIVELVLSSGQQAVVSAAGEPVTQPQVMPARPRSEAA